MATVASVSNTTLASGSTTVTITKPTGLAVGDLMIAQLYTREGDTFSTPADWTLVTSILQTGGSAASRLQIFSRVADAAAVAAANFAFVAVGNNLKGGGILRITDVSALVDVAQTNTAVGGSGNGTLTMTTQTPVRAQSVLLLFAAGGQSGTAAEYTVSSPAVTTDNPSWTTRWNENDPGAGAGTLYAASATRTQTTATGNATLSYSGGGGSNNIIGVFVLVNSSISNTHLPDSLEIASAVPLPGTQANNITATNESPTITKRNMPTQWQNEAKPTTNWQNEI